MTERPRRFYRRVTVAAGDGGFAISLDDRPAKTPAKARLIVPTAALAAAIAEEWAAQSESIDARSMPLTQLAATALDRIPGHREAVVDSIAAYGASDLLCYRADTPKELLTRQDHAWQPLLDWAAEEWGARLHVTRGVVPIAQPAATLGTLRRVVAGFADFPLTGLASAVQITGSLIVGLALARGRIDADAAHRVAILDESFQAELWGRDTDAERGRQRVADELRTARRFIDLSLA